MEPIHRPTKDEWAKFQGKQQWDIQVALRGPDCTKPEAIKWFSTSVIRGVISGAMRVGGVVNDDLRLIILPEAGPYGAAKSWAWDHFKDHVVTAAHWLVIPILYVPWGIWWNDRILDPHQYGQELYKFLVKVSAEDRYTSKQYTTYAEEIARHLKATWGITCQE